MSMLLIPAEGVAAIECFRQPHPVSEEDLVSTVSIDAGSAEEPPVIPMMLCVDRRGAWHRVLTRDLDVWVRSIDIQPLALPAKAIVSDDLPSQTQIRIRDRPEEGANVVAVLKPGDCVDVLSTGEASHPNWLHIRLLDGEMVGVEAWVMRAAGEHAIVVPILPALFRKSPALPPDTSLRIRSAPSENGNVLGLFSGDYLFGFLNSDVSSWLQIRDPATEALAWVQLRTSSGIDLLVPCTDGVECLRISSSLPPTTSLRIRAEPSIDSETLHVLEYSDAVHVARLYGDSEWGAVVSQGVQGWVLLQANGITTLEARFPLDNSILVNDYVAAIETTECGRVDEVTDVVPEANKPVEEEQLSHDSKEPSEPEATLINVMINVTAPITESNESEAVSAFPHTTDSVREEKPLNEIQVDLSPEPQATVVTETIEAPTPINFDDIPITKRNSPFDADSVAVEDPIASLLLSYSSSDQLTGLLAFKSKAVSEARDEAFILPYFTGICSCIQDTNADVQVAALACVAELQSRGLSLGPGAHGAQLMDALVSRLFCAKQESTVEEATRCARCLLRDYVDDALPVLLRGTVSRNLHSGYQSLLTLQKSLGEEIRALDADLMGRFVDQLLRVVSNAKPKLRSAALKCLQRGLQLWPDAVRGLIDAADEDLRSGAVSELITKANSPARTKNSMDLSPQNNSREVKELPLPSMSTVESSGVDVISLSLTSPVEALPEAATIATPEEPASSSSLPDVSSMPKRAEGDQHAPIIPDGLIAEQAGWLDLMCSYNASDQLNGILSASRWITSSSPGSKSNTVCAALWPGFYNCIQDTNADVQVAALACVAEIQSRGLSLGPGAHGAQLMDALVSRLFCAKQESTVEEATRCARCLLRDYVDDALPVLLRGTVSRNLHSGYQSLLTLQKSLGEEIRALDADLMGRFVDQLLRVVSNAKPKLRSAALKCLQRGLQLWPDAVRGLIVAADEGFKDNAIMEMCGKADSVPGEVPSPSKDVLVDRVVSNEASAPSIPPSAAGEEVNRDIGICDASAVSINIPEPTITSPPLKSPEPKPKARDGESYYINLLKDTPRQVTPAPSSPSLKVTLCSDGYDRLLPILKAQPPIPVRATKREFASLAGNLLSGESEFVELLKKYDSRPIAETDRKLTLVER